MYPELCLLLEQRCFNFAHMDNVAWLPRRLHETLAASEHRWPSLRTNDDFVTIWQQLFTLENCDAAHTIFEDFDGGWFAVIRRLRRLYRPQALERPEEVADLETTLEDIYRRGFGRISPAWRDLQDQIDNNVVWSEDDDDDVRDVPKIYEALENQVTFPEVRTTPPGLSRIPPIFAPIKIECPRCRMVKHPRPTSTNPKGTVHVLKPCEACQHRWNHLHYGSSAERHSHETHERNRIFAEVESVSQQRFVEFQRLLHADKHKELQQLLDTWVLAEVRAVKFRQSAIDAAVAAHDPNQSMSHRLRSEHNGFGAVPHSRPQVLLRNVRGVRR